MRQRCNSGGVGSITICNQLVGDHGRQVLLQEVGELLTMGQKCNDQWYYKRCETCIGCLEKIYLIGMLNKFNIKYLFFVTTLTIVMTTHDMHEKDLRHYHLSLSFSIVQLYQILSRHNVHHITNKQRFNFAFLFHRISNTTQCTSQHP